MSSISAITTIYGNEFKSKEEANKAAEHFLKSVPSLDENEYKSNVVLITGANKGIGYETARKLGSKGFKVLLACRDAQRGQEAQNRLQQQDKSASFQFVQLDVSSSESIAAAVETVRSLHGRLDVLINNAGVAAGFAQPSEVTADNARKVIETNLVGPIIVTKAFIPLLEKSANARIVNVSSVVGSNAAHRYPDGGCVEINVADYCSSKAGLNLYTAILANEFLAKKSNMRVNAVCPGYTATDLNHNSGTQTVDEGTEAVVAASLIAARGPTGTYFNRFGFIAW